MEKPVRVLFLCEANAARSQMAEALLRAMRNGAFEAYSAGLEPQAVHPLALKAMAEIGIDMSGQRSKHLNEYMDERFDYVITLCDRVSRNCPAFLHDNQSLHWACDDPLEAQGTEEERMTAFRRVRDDIRAKLDAWTADVMAQHTR